ncbi:MAG: hypothetical protein CTY24_02245 [Methylobacter sp.]|nr:MAG: hypothetical protein CTY24_02245 [Methylobacter sp.]
MVDRLVEFAQKRPYSIILAVLLFRFAYLFVNGLDLIGDESYYWDWSRRPDWCYYSKPPMVAWLIGLSTWLGGDYTAVVRLPAVVLGTVFLVFFYAVANVFFNRKAAAIALLMVLAMPFNALANLVMTIDPPLYCFWIISLYFLHNALFKQQPYAWFWAGLATAAAVLSKQTALLLPLVVGVFLALDYDRRKLFKREFLIYLAPIIVCIIPILLWNQQHDWVMFGHSKGHFGVKESASWIKRLDDTASFEFYQMLLATPVLYPAILMMTWRAGFKFKQLTAKEQFLLLSGPFLLAIIIVLSLIQKVQGNWPIPFYFSALILLAGQYAEGNWQKTMPRGLLTGFAMVLITYALPLLIQIFNLHHTVVDPTYRFRHWHELASAIDSERRNIISDQQQTFILTLGHRYLASELAFYLPDHPKTFRYEPSGLITSQYEVWPGPINYIGKQGLIITEQNPDQIPVELKSAFQSFKEVATVVNPMNINSPYHLYLGTDLKSWPPQKAIF